MAYDPRSGRLERIANRRGLTDDSSDSSDSGGSDSDPGFDPRPPSRVDRSPDDDRDQTDPGSRQPSGGGGGGASDPEPEPDPVRESTTVDPRSGRLERIAIDRGLVDSERQTVDAPSGASRTARTIDAITDGIQRSSPAATAAVSGLATSFRSESGVPIPGTNRSLPGREDFRNFRQGLEGPAQRVDSAIGSAVDRATIDPENAPFELEDIPLNDPTTAVVGATLGTEAGQRGAQAGVERGLESFNPARAVQDASLFAEFGVRGTDRVLDADEEEIDEGIETGTEVAGTVREEGPEVAAATVAQDPSTAFEVGATAATVGILGAAGPSAAGSAARAGRRAGGDAIDSGAIRRVFDADGRSFVDDTRGQQQLIQRGRSRQRSGGGDDELGPPRPRTDEVRDQGGIQRDRARRGFGQGRDGRLGRGRGDPDGFRDATFARDPSEPPEPEFGGLDSATRRLDGDFETPRDPLDTRGGGFGAIETGATVGGALGAGQQTGGGLFDEATAGAIEREIIGETTGQVGGTGTDTGTGSDTDVGVGTGTDTDTDPFAGTDEDVAGLTRFEARATVAPRSATDTVVDSLTGFDTASPFDDPTPADPTRTGSGVTRPPRGPGRRRVPTFDVEFDDADDELAADFAAAEAVFENPTQSLDDVSDDLRTLDRITEGFDAP